MCLIIFSQMADCGGLPQVVQVDVYFFKKHLHACHVAVFLSKSSNFILYLTTARETC